MLGLFRGAHTQSSGFGGRAVLRLEGLEWRDQPSGLDTGAPPDAGDQSGDFYLTPTANAPPEIVDFSAELIGDGLYLVTGRVIDEAAGGLTVTFGGSTDGSGRTTTTYEDGTFSILIRLPTDGTGAGYLTASTLDNQGLESNEPAIFLDPDS
jgi:hypothetical protein